jgi:hypothetical protein
LWCEPHSSSINEKLVAKATLIANLHSGDHTEGEGAFRPLNIAA